MWVQVRGISEDRRNGRGVPYLKGFLYYRKTTLFDQQEYC